MDDRRSDARDTFLGNAGWAGAKCELLAADASFRRYERVHLNERIAVLMDAPPPKEDIRPFVRIAKYLVQLGFSAPRLLAEDERRGFLLLEDLGDDTYTRVLAAGGDENALYELAVDTLIHLHELSSADAVPVGTPAYDMDRLMAEVMLLPEWYLPAVTGAALNDNARADHDAAWRHVFAEISTRRETLVLRDYHVDNLMWLPGRVGTARCGLLDFQDALAGPRAYDLMSLLEDARRDVPAPLSARMIQRYLDGMDDMDANALTRDMAILGAGRHAKVIGIFTRLWRRDGKAQYLRHIARVWRLLEASLAHPALSPVAIWFADHVPPHQRRTPDPDTDA